MILHFYNVFKSRLLLFLLITTCPFLSFSQQKYWVDQKKGAPDKSMNIAPEFCSSWLKTCSYLLDSTQVQELKRLGFELSAVQSFALKHTVYRPSKLSYALEQIGAREIIERGLTGKGITIGIIDGGFLKANEEESLQHIFQQQSVKWYRDYVTPDMQDYDGSVGLDDDHGTQVWENIGGYNSQKKIRYGLASNATYLLARTDHGGYEKRIEEDYLIEALESMTEQGAQIINISLGYNTGYMEATENYKPQDMDGKTTKVAQAVDVASKEKGVLVVVAAGNEALDSKWQVVSSPGDAVGALTVGASKFPIWDKMNYSSIGPEFLDYVKPNISVYATNGTSYAAPIITGMAACLLEYDSTLTNTEIMSLLEKAGHFYPYANNYLGYGVPTASRIFQVLDHKESEIVRPKLFSSDKDVFVLREKIAGKTIVTYHKKDDRNVIARVNYHPLKNKLKVKRLNGAVRTSILIEKRVIEVIWSD